MFLRWVFRALLDSRNQPEKVLTVNIPGFCFDDTEDVAEENLHTSSDRQITIYADHLDRNLPF